MEDRFRTCYDEAFQGWEQKVNDVGVIYFVNNSHHLTSWQHPYLDKIFRDLGPLFADVKYGAYRTALKLRTLQMQLGLQWMSIVALREIFPVCLEERDTNNHLTYEQGLLEIERLLQISDVLGIHGENIPRAADLILNFIANLYDKSHSGKLLSRCIQTALAVLSKARLSDKYKFFCSMIEDQHGRIPRDHLLHLIDDLMRIPALLKEGEAFGIDVQAALDSCFSKSPCMETDSVSPSCFYSWLCLEPQTLVWLPTLHRTIATENVQHAVRCCACRVLPITGFRYRCLVCFGYDLCQNCFFLGRISLPHKDMHPVKEYCFPVTTKDNTKTWLKIIKNKLLRRRRGTEKLAYLPVESRREQEALLDWEPHSIEVDAANSLNSLCPSTDSGPYNLDMQAGTAATDHRQEGEEVGGKKDAVVVNRKPRTPLEVLGQPFDSSSPIAGSVVKEKEFISKPVIETQQKIMALKIEELQRENRILQNRLQVYQQHKTRGEVEDVTYSEEDCLKEITAGSPISTISDICAKIPGKREASEDVIKEGNNKSRQAGHDTLAIVGTFTPVRGKNPSAITVEPPALVSSPNDGVNHDFTDLSLTNGLQYRSSDMSLLSADDNRHLSHADRGWEEAANTDVNLTQSIETVSSCNPQASRNSVLSLGGDSKPSDMSLLCLGFSKYANLVGASKGPSSPEKIKEAITEHSLQGCSFNIFTCNEDATCNPSTSQLRVAQQALCPGAATCSSIELSHIHPEIGTTSQFFTPDLRDMLSLEVTPEQFITDPHQRTIEPVYMSTPVVPNTSTKRTKSLDNVSVGPILQSQDRVHNDFNVTEDKENIISPQRKTSSTDKKVGDRKVLTVNNSANKQTLDLQCLRKNESTDQASIFKRPDNRKDSQTMLTQDREELNQIMAEFEQECKIYDCTQPDVTRMTTVNDSSVMAVAFNIGEALAEFVQAVGKCGSDRNVSQSHVTEMTQF